MRQNYLGIALGFLLFFWPFGSSQKTFHLNASSAVPAASATVKLGQDSNGNTTIDLRVYHLAYPTKLTPSFMAYVVWIQPNGRPAEELGQLRVNSHLTARFKAITPYSSFRLLVAAANNTQAVEPGSHIIFHGEVSR